eukprot:Lithocolla_globosa_v1_NODE_6771_length_1037_cov_8.634420.p1 type:complete len:314 gc:universal NODE_6771_length_1037_cov_8.634420:970-29(-)
MASQTKDISVDEFFASTEPPPSLEKNKEKLAAFLELHKKAGRKVALVTSGGTTVPLETQTVRFVDNFSAGTRGATSAEYFLKQGYAVVFMHRQHSLQPFSRHYSHSTHCFLDLVQSVDGNIQVKPKWKEEMLHVLKEYEEVVEKNLLLQLTFVTIKEYLWLLQASAQAFGTFKKECLFYLAAAVSDFFIPDEKMVEHKIQSSDGALTLTMDKVPKVLSPLVKQWSPDAFLVSFKLETDEGLVIPKSRQSLARYGHKIVIGNTLDTRKWKVTFVTPETSSDIILTEQEQQQQVEIESRIVPELARLHSQFIQEK